MSGSGNHEVATLGGGCFWCLDGIYSQLKGVESVVSGYAGGASPIPVIAKYAAGTPVTPKSCRSPTIRRSLVSRSARRRSSRFTIPRPRIGRAGTRPQYRSIILTHSDEQARIAREAIADVTAEGIWDDPIVTKIEPLTTFYPAEAYHQDYFANNPNQPYCQVVIAPKVSKFRRKYLEKLGV